MADVNIKQIAFGLNTYHLQPDNLTSDTQLTNAAQDATETANRVYPVRLDANGKLAVNVPWTSSGAQDMTGATATTAGTHGLVPAPAAGDQDKVLKGDGTWKEAIEVKVGKLTATTSNNGACYTDVDFDSIILLSCWEKENANCVTPLKSTNGKLGFRVSSTSGGNWTVAGNVTRTVYYSYIDKALPSYS